MDTTIRDITIEELKKSEIPFLLDLFALPDIDNGKILSVTEASALFDKIKTYPDYKVYVAKVNERIVGSFSLVILDNMVHNGLSSGLVESVVVHNQYRSRGIGKKMMEFAIQKCKEAHCYKMSLSSNMIRHRAHSFYERLGFRKHGYSFMIDLKD